MTVKFFITNETEKRASAIRVRISEKIGEVVNERVQKGSICI
jgi:hypothetical protein